MLAAAAATGNADIVDIVDMVIANAPAMRDSQGGMWIKLTVGGVTRLGYGSDDDRGPDHDKKLTSDAIRNAAMRFGVALDLWSKESLAEAALEPAPSEPVPSQPVAAGRDWIAEAQACTEVKPLLELGRECNTELFNRLPVGGN